MTVTIEFLTVPEVADRLRVSAPTIYRLARTPGFPAVRVGGQIRVRAAEFERWLQDREGGDGGRAA